MQKKISKIKNLLSEGNPLVEIHHFPLSETQRIELITAPNLLEGIINALAKLAEAKASVQTDSTDVVDAKTNRTQTDSITPAFSFSLQSLDPFIDKRIQTEFDNFAILNNQTFSHRL